MAQKKKEIDGENILYHILQKLIIDPSEAENPCPEVKFMIEQLILYGGIWFSPKIYEEIPVLLPYVIRDPKCRDQDPATGKDTRGVATPKGLMPDDNSSIKGIPKSLKIKSCWKEMNGKTMANGFVASHVWRELVGMNLLASRWECTNSFIPNLVWLPRQISKLTDREGTYAQKFIQHLSRKLYGKISIKEPILADIWNKLADPGITPICKIDLEKLHYFDYNDKLIKRRKENLVKELKSIINILDGQEPEIKKINTGSYVRTLTSVSQTMNAADKNNLKIWVQENLKHLQG